MPIGNSWTVLVMCKSLNFVNGIPNDSLLVCVSPAKLSCSVTCYFQVIHMNFPPMPTVVNGTIFVCAGCKFLRHFSKRYQRVYVKEDNRHLTFLWQQWGFPTEWHIRLRSRNGILNINIYINDLIGDETIHHLEPNRIYQACIMVSITDKYIVGATLKASWTQLPIRPHTRTILLLLSIRTQLV